MANVNPKITRGTSFLSCKQLLETNEPQTLWLTSKGVDENQVVVSTFEFEWTLLTKN